jgi:hypothetical protein
VGVETVTALAQLHRPTAELVDAGVDTGAALAAAVEGVAAASPDSPALGDYRRYVTLLDPLRLGKAVSVFIQVRLEQQVERTLKNFEAAVASWPEVMECYLMTGDSDYLLRVVVADIPALERFILDRLTTIKGVANIRSSFALKQVKYETALPLPSSGRTHS